MKWSSRALFIGALGTLLTASSAIAQTPPVAEHQALTTPEDTAKTITLSATDPEGDPLTFTVVAAPLHGTLVGTPPDLTYQPEADYFGPDSITFKANDGSADSNTATVDLTVTPVNDWPTGTVVINAGLPEMTRSAAVRLTLTAADVDGGPIRMCISNTNRPACTTWPTLTAPTMIKSWKLASGSGMRTVNVWFRDQSGIRTLASDTILLDTTKPSGGMVSVTPGNTKLALSWEGFTDGAGSGVVGYRAVFLKGSTPPLSCAAGTPVPGYDGISTTLVHTTLADMINPLVNGTTYAYRICAIDAVGNMSAGATKTGKPVEEPDPPTGTVTINRGAVGTRSTAATLTIEAHDASGPIRMCISNTAACSSWTAYTPSTDTGNMTRSWTLTRGNGTKTVNVRFRDRWGNTSQTPESDTIILDKVKPANGPVLMTPGNEQLTLRWEAFPDNPGGSDVVKYQAVFLKGSTPPLSCAAGTPVPDYDDTSTTLVHTTLADGITRLANGTTYAYRVCAIDAAGNISTGATVTGKPADTTAPTGTVAINGGAAATNSTAAALTLTAVDDGSGAIEMCISNTAACSDWEPFEAAPVWTLAAGDGIKTVNVWYRDESGNPSATPNSDTILLDTTAPTDGTVAATPGDTQLTLNWSGFADTAGSGITGYQAVFQQGGTPGSCAAGTPVPGYVSPATTLVHAGLLNGTPYGYRVCAIDAVGFISPGATATGQPAATPPPDTTAPTGTVTINGGAAATNSTAATLALSAVDDGGGAIQMCISNTATCSDWAPFNATPTWTLAAGDGTATVNVWYRDQLNNTSATPNSDTILLDTATPTDGTVTATEGDTQLTLNWSGFADTAGSGITGYQAVFQQGSAPVSCASGTPVPGYVSPATTLVHADLLNGTTYGYRVCAIDAVGNVSTGATATGQPTPPPPDTTAPTGTVTINAGAAATNSTAATLTLTAADDGGGAIQMCISNSETCSAWAPFETAPGWTLAAVSGTATVNVWYRDQLNNTSATPNSDTIIVDTTAPEDGTVTAAAGITQQLTLSWSGFADPEGSGVTGYQAVFQVGGAPASCSAGTQVPGYAGVATALVHTGLVNGTTYGYRVCAIDAAGNRSAGAAASGQPVATACETCHNGNPPPEHALAPNVMGDGTLPAGDPSNATPKPYDDGTWGFNVNGHGSNGTATNTPLDSYSSPFLVGNAACTACHDINLPAGTHLDGILNSVEQSQNQNGNTAHLIAAYMSGTSSPEWDVQVKFDAVCYAKTGCHVAAMSHRHARDADPAVKATRFGDGGTVLDGQSIRYPIDVDLTTNASTAGRDYAPCISCHNPHGTPIDYTTQGKPTNKMLRDLWVVPDTLCRECHR